MEAVAAPLWSSRRIREGVAYLGLAGLVASSALIVMGAEGRLGVLVPAAKLRYPDWLRGPLSGLGIALTPNGLAWLLVGMSAGYVLVLVCGPAPSVIRWWNSYSSRPRKHRPSRPVMAMAAARYLNLRMPSPSGPACTWPRLDFVQSSLKVS